jgi:outer membrane lipoprotein-sorting protein
MKKLLLILLMFLSVCAFAQTRKKHAKKKASRTSKHRVRHNASIREEEPVQEEEFQYVTIGPDKKIVFTDPPDGQEKPFVIINDTVYNGRLQDLKVGSIIDVSVVKRKGARIMYGAKAAAGAIIIKTKQHLPANLSYEALPLPKPKAEQKSFMFNEEVTYGKVEDLSPKDILSIDTLIQPKFVGSKDNDTTVSVITKAYGKKLYQWKFGTLSKAYKTYIRSRRGNDGGVNYVLSDGTTLAGGKEEDLIKLLKVYNSDPKAADFTGPHGTRKNRTPATLTIELNQPTK